MTNNGFDFGEIDAICDNIGVSNRKGMNPYCPHIPYAKQKAFLECEDLEAMYGGAAGGGKSDAILMGALEGVKYEGFSALILRRTFRDLNQESAILNRCHKWLKGTDAKWSQQDMRYTFPKTGATITFGYFDHERHKDQYASAEFQYIGWDELTQFPENWYRWLFSRLRKLKAHKYKPRVRSATNPGNIGHAWVKRRFVDKLTAQGTFFPARLTDNQYIDQAQYKESLSKLDRVTRKQLEDGVWNQDTSLLVYSLDLSKNVILAAPELKHRVLGLDFGLKRDHCSYNILGWRPNDPKVYIEKSWKKQGVVPSEVREVIRNLNDNYKFERMVGDSGGLGLVYTEEARRFGIPVEDAEKTNKRGYISLFNGELEQERILIVESGCAPLIEEMQELPWADENRVKEADGFDNHCTDGSLYGWRACRAWLSTMGNPMPMALPGPFSKW